MTSAKFKTARRAGFTMIEVLIALAMFGILAAFAIARIGPGLVHARVNRAVSVLATDLQFAQQMASRRRSPITVVIQFGEKRYVVQDRQTGAFYRRRDMGPQSAFAVDQITVSPSAPVLFPNGVAAQTTTFTVRLKTYSRSVTVTRAGQVRIL